MKNLIDLNKLSDKQKQRVEKALNRRDTVLSLRFKAEKIERWKKQAASKQLTMTEWIEGLLYGDCD